MKTTKAQKIVIAKVIAQIKAKLAKDPQNNYVYEIIREAAFKPCFKDGYIKGMQLIRKEIIKQFKGL